MVRAEHDLSKRIQDHDREKIMAATQLLVVTARSAQTAGDCLTPVPTEHAQSLLIDKLHTLTKRQLQVAELVSHGHTNRQIARLLFLSEKTIETHLAHIFAKLGISSRAAIASTVTKAQITA
jgi:DNA-binding NarL/FixJ family response regulator